MAKSALLKSSLAKKYWMALTGLFLCLFLVGHLAGNLQLLVPDNASNFNKYALFMTTNPAVKALSYLTYLSVLLHVVDGFLLVYQNRKARPIGYAYERQEANTNWSSRNMAILGTLILVFIVTHMITFWYPMHYDNKFPLQKLAIEGQMPGMKQEYYITSGWGKEKYIPVNAVDGKNVIIEGSQFFYVTPTKVQFAEGYKDLYKITIEFFKDKQYGLIFTLLYVLSMTVLGFHLWHGFASAFQSLGLNNRKYNSAIRATGRGFAVLVPFLFAIIPLYIHFLLKA